MKESVLAVSLGFLVLLANATGLCADYYVSCSEGRDTNSGLSPDEPWLTVTHAISAAEASQQDPATIHIEAGTYSHNSNGETFPIVLMSHVSLLGAGRDVTVLDAENDAFHVVFCCNVQNVALSGLTMTGGEALGTGMTDTDGGGVYCLSGASLSISDCIIEGNRAVSGGGIKCEMGSTILVEDCVVRGNEAEAGWLSEGFCWGGGIGVVTASAMLRRCTMDGNTAMAEESLGGFSSGGGVYAEEASDCAMEDCLLANNTADFGAGVYIVTCSPTIEGCVIRQNEGIFGGGANCDYEASPLIQDCEFDGNLASDSGGGLSICRDSSPNIDGCTFIGNIVTGEAGAGSHGGGIYTDDSAAVIRNSEFSGNSAGIGGGVHTQGEPAATIEGCDFTSNYGEWGAGVCSATSSPTITDCTIHANEASGEQAAGAAFYCSRSTPTVTNCEITDNVVTHGWYVGGGLLCYRSSPTFLNCLITGNSVIDEVGTGGAAQIFQGSSAAFLSCTIADNSASQGGGLYLTESSSADLLNTILYSNTEEVVLASEESTISIEYSCVEGGHQGQGNLSENPLFASGPMGYYYLSALDAGQDNDSPCIDAGSGTPADYDLGAFTTRTDGAPDVDTVDMGYHYPVQGERPTICCSLNQTVFGAGDTIVGSLEAANHGVEVEVDAYVAFVLPDGAVVSMTANGFAVGVQPWFTNVMLPTGFEFGPAEVVRIPIPSGMAAGSYMFAAGLSQPGTTEFYNVSYFPFTVSD